LIAINLAVLAVLVIGGIVAAVVGARTVGELRERQRAIDGRMQSAAKATDVQIREFTNRRSALEPLRSGPLGKLDQQIQLMKLLADEQLVLIEQFGPIRDEIRPATRPATPRARRQER
jgi:hypothetical protein